MNSNCKLIPLVQLRSTFVLLACGICFAPGPSLAQPPPGSNSDKPLPADAPSWTYAVRRDLEKKCQEQGGRDSPSCFEIPIGGKVAGLVPVGEVSEAEKPRFWEAWKEILQPDLLPQGPAIVTWRKLQLTKVAWGPAKAVGESRGWGPPQVDWICAKWEVDGKPIVAINRTITLRLSGPDRLRYRHPTAEEVGTRANTYIVETQIDKPALLDILITAFQVPWQELTDFLVRWSLAGQGPDSLRIRSARFNKEADPPDWREWFDDFSFEISGDDPQYLSFGFFAPQRK